MLLASQIAHGQSSQDKVLQLETALAGASTYQDSIKEMRGLAWYHMRHNLSEAEKWTLSFQEKAKLKGDPHTSAVSKHYLGLIRRFEGNYAAALPLFKQALTWYQSDRKYQPSQLGALFNLGVINQEIGDYEKALSYFYEEHALAKELDVQTGRANTLNSIGVTFRKIGNFEKALQIYNEAIPYAVKEGDRATQANLLSNRAMVKYDLGDNQGAIADNFASLKIDKQDDYKKGMSASYLRLARIYLKVGKLNQALSYAEACFDLIADSDFLQDMVESKFLLAEVYYGMKDFRSAEEFATAAYEQARAHNLLETMRMCKELLAKTYAQTNRFALAYKAQIDMNSLEAKLGKQEQIALVKNLEIRHEVDQQQQALERLQSENELKQKDLQKQKKLRTILLIALALAIATIVLVQRILSLRLYAQRLRSERNDSQKEQKIQQILATNRLTRLNAMIQGQEIERTRIAKDLHDGLGGLLSSVKIHFLSVQRQIEALNKLIPFDKASLMLDEACEEVRRIAHNMIPEALEQLGLQAAILDMTQTLEEKGYEVHTQLLDFDDPLSDELGINLYRIIQELINNIIKYAEASKIIIQFSMDPETIYLTVEDNGKGFDPNAKYSGIGLQNIKSRVDFLGGEIDIGSAPGEGTSIFISAPFKRHST